MTQDMLAKIQEMKQKMDETIDRLGATIVEGEAGSGTVKVKMNANRVVKDISINQMLFEGSSANELEDLLVIALNRAMEKVEKIHTQEMQQSASIMLPGLT